MAFCPDDFRISYLIRHINRQYIRVHVEHADDNIKHKWTVHVTAIVPLDDATARVIKRNKVRTSE